MLFYSTFSYLSNDPSMYEASLVYLQLLNIGNYIYLCFRSLALILAPATLAFERIGEP